MMIQPLQPAQAKVTDPAAPKKMPAPGQSPQGGTTSLPQHLQTPGSIGGGVPGGTGGTTPAMPQAPAAPSSQAPGTVPAPPPSLTGPAIPAAPPAPHPGPLTPNMDPSGNTGASSESQNAQMHTELFQKLMDMIKNPNPYDAEAVKQTRATGMQNLEDQRKLGEDRAVSDAASRGVYYGSPLTNSLGDIGERYMRGQGDLEAKIAQDQAQRYSQDQQNAIASIFGYGDRQDRNKQWQDELWLKLQELGYGGMPNMPQAPSMIQT